MKTAKVALILALISFTLMGFASVNYDHASVIVKISLDNAQHDKGLSLVMYQQIDQSFLRVEHEGFYVAKVQHKNITFFIFGTYKDWKDFLNRKMVYPEKFPTL